MFALSRAALSTGFASLLLTLASTVGLAPGNVRAQAPAAAGSPAAGLKTALFDGQTLAGWTIEGDCQAAVVDGLLVLQQGNGWLRSDLMFRDFDLHVEWKAIKSADYDSGIYIRTLSGGTPFPRESYQINLLDGAEGNCKQLKETVGTKGKIRRGEWNSFDISVRKETVSLSINGEPVYRVAGLKDREGHIGLQCEVDKGGQFQFRNITVTEPGFKSLFNGTDLTGWEGGGEDAALCWKVEPERRQLVCTGAKGPWLKSAAEYGNFDLRFEYQVSGGGNSGVYVRVPADGNHHRENDTLPPAGFEVQLLDDAAPQYATLKDYQYSAPIRHQRALKPSLPSGATSRMFKCGSLFCALLRTFKSFSAHALQAAMVCVDALGNHVRSELKEFQLEAQFRDVVQGAARIGFSAFPYSVYAVGMQDAQVVTV